MANKGNNEEIADMPDCKPAGISKDDPLYLELEEIINDPENEELLIKAVEDGVPPLGYIEKVIVQKLGDKYSNPNFKKRKNQAVRTVGDFVVKRMKALGYNKVSRKNMPEGSVAKRAMTFVK